MRKRYTRLRKAEGTRLLGRLTRSRAVPAEVELSKLFLQLLNPSFMASHYVNMTALGKSTTTTFGFGVGVTVWDSLVTAGIIISTGIALYRRSKYWVEATLVHIGLVLLSLSVSRLYCAT
jgi:hypothetical protein